MLKQKNMILRLVAIACAVLAFVFMFLPGLSAKEEVMGQTVSGSIGLFGLVFCGGTMASKMGSISADVKFKGGMSIFALLAFLCLTLFMHHLFVKIPCKITWYFDIFYMIIALMLFIDQAPTQYLKLA